MNKKMNCNAALNQGESVGPQVYRILRDQIIQGLVAPGRRFSEVEISRQFKVSRQPVREAFIKLRNEGLVEVRPQRGTFVTKIHIDAVSDARFIREAIEADIVKLLVKQSSPQIISELRTHIQQQRDFNSSTGERFMTLDEQFHRALAQSAGKARAWKVVADMKAHLDRVRHLSTIEKPMGRLIDQHEAIVDAIENRDQLKADRAIRHHLQEVLRDLPAIIAKQPDLFVELSATENVVEEAT